MSSGPAAELSADSATREETFLRELFEQHAPTVLRFAVGLCHGDWHRAEDILQEAALRAWNNGGPSGLRTEGATRRWLYTVVRNLVIDQYRSRRARPAELMVYDPPETAVPDGTEHAVTMRVVIEAMGDLTGSHREILLHLYYLGHDVAQTSHLLGVPPGTVKSRAFNATRALRRALRDRGVVDA